MCNMVDFLGMRSEKVLRREILNICNSYNNYWDILCEITQNSYDAIKRYIKMHGEDDKKHSIDIIINSRERSIRIVDTGTGIDSQKIKDILGPNGTDKDEEFESIGEKGVGLT